MNDMFSLQDIVDEVDARRDRLPGTRRIAVAGEFESGKSSVINALIGKLIVPCNPGLRGRPLIKVSHSSQPLFVGEDSTGCAVEAESIEALRQIRDLAVCEIHISVPGMARTEIVEIPHHPGGSIAPGDFRVMAEADLIVWVTIASQAWRLSEKATVETLPPGSRRKSVLAISRADLLRDEEDWTKIETRLQKEASPYFSEMVFMQASLRNLEACRRDEQSWIETGGPSLAGIAHEIASGKQGAAA